LIIDTTIYISLKNLSPMMDLRHRQDQISRFLNQQMRTRKKNITSQERKRKFFVLVVDV